MSPCHIKWHISATQCYHRVVTISLSTETIQWGTCTPEGVQARPRSEANCYETGYGSVPCPGNHSIPPPFHFWESCSSLSRRVQKPSHSPARRRMLKNGGVVVWVLGKDRQCNNSSADVYKEPLSLDVSKAKGLDGVGPSVLRHCAFPLCEPLTHLFQQSLLQYSIPTEWKMHCITPIYKSGNKDCVSNYRPIFYIEQHFEVGHSTLQQLFVLQHNLSSCQ